MSSFLGCMLIGVSLIIAFFFAVLMWGKADEDKILCVLVVCSVLISAIGGAFFHKAMLEEEERRPADPITWGDLDEIRQLLESSGLENSE